MLLLCCVHDLIMILDHLADLIKGENECPTVNNVPLLMICNSCLISYRAEVIFFRKKYQKILILQSWCLNNGCENGTGNEEYGLFLYMCHPL